MRKKLLTAALAGGALFAGNAQAQVEIQFWHSMGGALGEATGALANKFNLVQKE